MTTGHQALIEKTTTQVVDHTGQLCTCIVDNWQPFTQVGRIIDNWQPFTQVGCIVDNWQPFTQVDCIIDNHSSARATSNRSLEGGGGDAHMAKLGRVKLGWVKLSRVVTLEVEFS